MIRLTKSSTPQILVDNGDRWTRELLDYYAEGETPPDGLASKYREAEIKTAIRAETSDKCAYCEAKIMHSQYGDVEHIQPKSIFRNLTFAWENLTLACTVCNTKKSDYHDAARPLLHPYSDEPRDHLDTEGGLVYGFDTSIAGKITELKLEINRKELILQRSERLRNLMPLVQRCERETDDIKKSVLLEQLRDEARDEKEFSLVVRKMLSRRGLI